MTALDGPETGVPPFTVVSGRQVDQVLRGRETAVIDVVRQAYLLHGQQQSVNPPSYFLRFPDRPQSRIIALPASLGGPRAVDGIKWISSFPDNVRTGIPRASAVLILNDPETGYPFACLESSIISACRTAASAVLAAGLLAHDGRPPRRLGIIGAGLIARYVRRFLYCAGWEFDQTVVYDVSAEYGQAFLNHLGSVPGGGTATLAASCEQAVRDSDLVVFATVADRPYLQHRDWLSHNPLVIHLSLRDLAPEVVLECTNVVDDVDHCLRAGTSLHLAEQATGGRDFVHGTLYDVLTGDVTVATGRPVVFSPFGLGILDLAVGSFVHDLLAERNELVTVAGFFADLDRYGGSSACR